MQGSVYGNAYRTAILCVDSCQSGILNGRIYHPYLENGESFKSLMEFLHKMESLLDAMQLPQSFTELRSFSTPPPMMNKPTDLQAQEGTCGTFAIRVLFRQNASWQGSVTWLEGNREESFRSALELVLLLDSALNTAAAKQEQETPLMSCEA